MKNIARLMTSPGMHFSLYAMSLLGHGLHDVAEHVAAAVCGLLSKSSVTH